MKTKQSVYTRETLVIFKRLHVRKNDEGSSTETGRGEDTDEDSDNIFERSAMHLQIMGRFIQRMALR